MPTRRTSGPLPNLSTEYILDTKLEEIMNAIGLAGVKWAIQNHGFNNRTHNLEDSYGYAVYKDGVMQGDVFITNPKATQTVRGKSGHDEAIKFLKGYSAATNGFSVVVVAGMEYASFVEFYYGLDVLQSSQVQAEQVANKLLRNIKWESRQS